MAVAGSKLRVVMVAACPFPANHGSAASIREMSEALERLGHEVHVVTYPIREEILFRGCTVHRVSSRLIKPGAVRIGPSPDKIIYDLLLIFKLLKVIYKYKIDVIHAHNYEAAIIGWFGRLLGFRPMLYNAVTTMKEELPTYNFIRPKWLAAQIGSVLDWVVPRMATIITVVSDELKTYLVRSGLPERKVKVVPAGVYPDMFEHGDGQRIRQQYALGDAPLVMYTGAFEEFQRIDYLLLAMQWAAQRNPAARLVLVGNVKNQGQFTKFKDMARHLGIDDKTTFIESTPLADLPDYLAAADVVVVPRTECPGHPVKLLNYMAAGKAIVSFRGSAKGLHHMYNAYLADNHKFEALGRGIDFLLNSPADAAALGARARGTIHQTFDWNTIAKGIEQIYLQLTRRNEKWRRVQANPYLRESYTLAYVDRRAEHAATGNRQRTQPDRRVAATEIRFIERRKVAFPQPHRPGIKKQECQPETAESRQYSRGETMFDLARSDLHRKQTHYILNAGFVERFIKVPLQLGTLAVLAYRLGYWAEGVRTPVLNKLALIPSFLLNFLVASFTGIRITPQTEIGPGFIIHNFSSILIDARSIGSNFTVNQGVSVGSGYGNTGKPTIGNNVFLGSGAKVLGPITIGDNVVVAANALADKSIPGNCTVVGVPARIIARGSGSQYLNLTGAGPDRQA